MLSCAKEPGTADEFFRCRLVALVPAYIPVGDVPKHRLAVVLWLQDAVNQDLNVRYLNVLLLTILFTDVIEESILVV